jgi:hypothetical protein
MATICEISSQDRRITPLPFVVASTLSMAFEWRWKLHE